MEDKDYKNIEFENNAIINTAPEELPEEAHNIPQGVRPHLNPNPGYGEDGETKPAIKTVPVKGEVKVDGGVVTPPQVGFKGIQDVYNFLNGILVKGKKLEDYIDSQGGVTEEEMETFVNTFVNNALVADKDVISKITKFYDEENNLTTFNFPIGVMPLSITLNNQAFYFKENKAVNGLGEEVEGYETDEIYIDSEDSYITFNGDLTNQVINGISYVNYNKNVSTFGNNSYYLYYPQRSGTKLYRHQPQQYPNNIFRIVDNDSTPITMDNFVERITKCVSAIYIDSLFQPHAIIQVTKVSGTTHFKFSFYNTSDITTTEVSSFMVADTVTEL